MAIDNPNVDYDNGLLVPGGKPGDLQAAVITKQREDYQERFAPLEQRLRGMTDDSGDKEANAASEAIHNQNVITRASFQRDLARTGTQVTKRQQGAIDKARGLDMARSKANIENRTRRNMKDENMQTKGALIGIGRDVQQGVNRDLGTASGLQSQRDQANRNAKQQSKAQTQQGIATVAGIALAAFL